MHRSVIYWLNIFMIILILIAIFVAMFGCASVPKGEPNIPIPPEIQTVIKNISWVQGILVIGVVASIFACFNGAAKLGIPLLISSLIGYGLTSAMMFYARLIAIMSLAGGVSLCAYMIFIKSKALKEIIKGVQSYRTETKTTGIFQAHLGLDQNLKYAQSKSTETLVKKIKGNSNAKKTGN